MGEDREARDHGNCSKSQLVSLVGSVDLMEIMCIDLNKRAHGWYDIVTGCFCNPNSDFRLKIYSIWSFQLETLV